jgi:hypothetical protein
LHCKRTRQRHPSSNFPLRDAAVLCDGPGLLWIGESRSPHLGRRWPLVEFTSDELGQASRITLEWAAYLVCSAVIPTERVEQRGTVVTAAGENFAPQFTPGSSPIWVKIALRIAELFRSTVVVEFGRRVRCCASSRYTQVCNRLISGPRLNIIISDISDCYGAVSGEACNETALPNVGELIASGSPMRTVSERGQELRPERTVFLRVSGRSATILVSGIGSLDLSRRLTLLTDAYLASCAVAQGGSSDRPRPSRADL